MLSGAKQGSHLLWQSDNYRSSLGRFPLVPTHQALCHSKPQIHQVISDFHTEIESAQYSSQSCLMKQNPSKSEIQETPS